MAVQLAASIYGANSNDWGTPQGTLMSFPTQNIVIRQIDGGPTTYSGVTCVSQIQLLPTAPSTIQPVYYSAVAVGTLVTAANA